MHADAFELRALRKAEAHGKPGSLGLADLGLLILLARPPFVKSGATLVKTSSLIMLKNCE